MKSSIRNIIIALTLFMGLGVVTSVANAGELTGWGWSDGAGHVSFNCSNTNSCSAPGGVDYKVSFDEETTGVLSGYAWSDTVGWISFNPSVNNTCPLTAEDGGDCTPRVNLTTGKVQGWARAIAACKDDLWDGSKCTGSGAGDLSGTTVSVSGPVTWTERVSAGSRTWGGIASSADGMRLVTTVWGGYIYTSTDGGDTWTARTSAGSRAWYRVTSSSDGMRLAATDHGGYIYTSTDGGVTWVQRTSSSSTGTNWTDITSSSDGMRIFARSYGGALRISTDGGVTWSSIAYPGPVGESDGLSFNTPIASSADGMRLVANSPGDDYLYTSTDGGVTWTQRISSGQKNWTDITSSSDGMRLAATANGSNVFDEYIYTSTDGGVTWVQRTSISSRNWSNITSSADGLTLVASVGGGLNGYVYISNNGGATWTAQTEIGSRNWGDITSSSDGVRIATAVGGLGGYSNGYVYTTGGDGSTTSSGSGWDGWIHLSGVNHESPNLGGVTYNTTTGKFSGYAWGNINIGWFSFNPQINGNDDDGVVCCGPKVATVTISCSPSPNPVASGEDSTYTAVAGGGTAPYEYSWNGAPYVVNLDEKDFTDITSPITDQTVRAKDANGNESVVRVCPSIGVTGGGTDEMWVTSPGVYETSIKVGGTATVYWKTDGFQAAGYGNCQGIQTTGADISVWKDVAQAPDDDVDGLGLVGLQKGVYEIALQCFKPGFPNVSTNSVKINVTQSSIEER